MLVLEIGEVPVVDVGGEGMMDFIRASTSLGGGCRREGVDDGWDVTEG